MLRTKESRPVTPFFEEFQSEGIACVNHPDEQKPILLEFWKRKRFDVSVV